MTAGKIAFPLFILFLVYVLETIVFGISNDIWGYIFILFKDSIS